MMEACLGELQLQRERELIVAAAQALLWRARPGDLSSVSCDFHQGVLTLRGRVSSYYLKQLAQELLRPFGPVEQVNNRLQVEER
jgi:hypothetical protein